MNQPNLTGEVAQKTGQAIWQIVAELQSLRLAVTNVTTIANDAKAQAAKGKTGTVVTSPGGGNGNGGGGGGGGTGDGVPGGISGQLQINGGNALFAGGNLSGDVTTSSGTIATLSIVTSPGVFGDALNVPQITVDGKGRIINVSLVPIAAGMNQTPWLSNIDADFHYLNNCAGIGLNKAANTTILLDMSLSGSNNIGIRINDFSGALAPEIRLLSSGNAGIRSYGNAHPTTAKRKLMEVFNFDAMAFVTNNAERMRITATGLVGIGKTPATYALEVQGDLDITGTYRVNGVPIGSGGQNQTPWLSNIDAAGFQLTNTTKVGIVYSGTQVGALLAGGLGQVRLETMPGVTLSLYGAVADIIADTYITLSTSSNQERLRITAAGNVGIGNTTSVLPDADGALYLTVGSVVGTPVGAITVCGNTASGPIGAIQFANYAKTGADKRLALIIGATDGSLDSGRLVFSTYNVGGYAEKMRITAAGNVGIGVAAPSTLVHLGSIGNTTLTLESPSTWAPFVSYKRGLQQWWVGAGILGDDSWCVYNQTAAKTPFTITTANNVGIGRTPTTYPLEVQGDCNITGTYRVNGVPISSGGGGSQTPWTSDIQAAKFRLYDASSIQVTGQWVAGNVPNSLCLDNYNNNARLVGWGPNPSTPAGFHFVAISSDNSIVSYPFVIAGPSGRVGIGNVAPTARLTTAVSGGRLTAFNAGDATTWADVVVENPNQTASTATGIGFSLSSTYQGHPSICAGIAGVRTSTAADTDTDLAFITRPAGFVSAERMRITSAGNVGINCQPWGAAILDVIGLPGNNAVFAFRAPAGYGSFIEFGGTNWTELVCDSAGNFSQGFYAQVGGVFVSYRTGAVASTLVLNGGNVGVRVTSPAAPLEIMGGSGGADVVSGGIILTRYHAGTDFRAAALFEYYDSVSTCERLAFALSNSTNPYDRAKSLMTLDSNGDVGIGNGVGAMRGRLLVTRGNPNTVATSNQIVVGEASNNASYGLNLGYGVIAQNFGQWAGCIQTQVGGATGTLMINPNGGPVNINTLAAGLGQALNVTSLCVMPPSGVYLTIGPDPFTWSASAGVTVGGMFWDATNNCMRFDCVSGTVAWRNIVSNWNGGNFGVGPVQPQTRLHVHGAETNPANSVGNAIISGGTADHQLRLGFNQTNLYAWIQSVQNNVSARPLALNPNGANVTVGFGGAGSYQLHIASDSAGKPGTNTWAVYSDLRLKRDVRPYVEGLDTLLQLHPVSFEYNGESGTPDGLKAVGLSAQDVADIIPQCVRPVRGSIKGQEVEVLSLNTGDVQYMVLNALRELNERLRILEGI